MSASTDSKRSFRLASPFFPVHVNRAFSSRTVAAFGSLGAVGHESLPALVAKGEVPRLLAFLSHLDLAIDRDRRQPVPAAISGKEFPMRRKLRGSRRRSSECIPASK